MQENGTEQSKVYRRTRSMLKIRCTPTEVKQTGYRNSQLTETERAEFHTPAIPNMVRNCVKENSLENVSPDLVQPTVPTLDNQASASFDSKSEEREEMQIHLHLHWRWPMNQVFTLQDPESQQERTLESQPVHLMIFTCKRHYHIRKDTSASGTVDYQSKMLNFELYVMYIAKLAIFNSNHNRH